MFPLTGENFGRGLCGHSGELVKFLGREGDGKGRVGPGRDAGVADLEGTAWHPLLPPSFLSLH